VFAKCIKIEDKSNLIKIMNLNKVDSTLQNFLINELKLELTNVSIRDFSKSYKWLNGKKVFCIFDKKSESAYILLEDELENWKQINKKGTSSFFLGLIEPLINNIDTQSPNQIRLLAKTIFQLYNDPRGELLDDLFLTRNEKILFTYLVVDKKNHELLKSYCEKINNLENENGWQLNFNTMSKDGAILNWNVLYSDTLNDIKVIQFEKENTFYFPNEY